MDWTQALTIIISVFGLFLVAIPYLISRMEANKKDLEHKIDANQKENNAKFDQLGNRIGKLENRLTGLEAETKSELRNINQRLSSIETENKDISKRLSNIEGYLAPKKVFHFQEPHKEEDEPKEN